MHQVPADWDARRFADWLAWRVSDSPECSAWQIGNEIPFAPTPEEHAEWHSLAHAAVKSAHAAARVVTMAANVPGDEWMARFLAASPPFDALAVHIYGWPLPLMLERLAPALRGRTVWLTEFGLSPEVLPPGCCGEDWEDDQAEGWRALLEAAGRLGVRRAYGYSLFTDEEVERHGIYRPDGTPRPAAAMLREFTRTSSEMGGQP